MQVHFAASPSSAQRENLAIAFFEDASTHAQVLKAWPEAQGIARMLALKDFGGKLKECVVLYPEANGTQRLLAVGLGKKAAFGPFQALQAAAGVSRKAKTLGIEHISMALPAGADTQAALEGFAQGAVLGTYSFDRYREKPKEPKPEPKAFTLLSRRQSADSVENGRAIGEAICWVRDLTNTPSNHKTPTLLGEEARKMARKAGLSCKVLGKAEMEKLGMNTILGVSRGSEEPPAFVILEHKPKQAKKNRGPVVLVGKGITFDSGGISLKPGDSMHHMKNDMMGGAVVLGALRVAAELDLPVHVVGLVPFSENMPDGKAQKPGDVMTALNGKTVEVLNTDAEGRLVLADALAYAERYQPKALVDLATLTGAAGIALGRFCIAAMGTDQKLINRLQQTGESVGERVWQLPLWDEHLEFTKGEVADLKNISGVRDAGTIMGAAFLKPFAQHSPWCHLDIAATAWAQDDQPWRPKGPTGNGLRLMVAFLRNWR